MSQDHRIESISLNPGRSSKSPEMRGESFNRMSVSLAQIECCICMDSKPDAVIMECGHGGICYECGKHIIANEGVCHLCRNDIQYILKMDLDTMYSNFIKVISATFLDDQASDDGGEAQQQV